MKKMIVAGLTSSLVALGLLVVPMLSFTATAGSEERNTLVSHPVETILATESLPLLAGTDKGIVDAG